MSQSWEKQERDDIEIAGAGAVSTLIVFFFAWAIKSPEALAILYGFAILLMLTGILIVKAENNVGNRMVKK